MAIPKATTTRDRAAYLRWLARDYEPYLPWVAAQLKLEAEKLVKETR